MLSLSLPQSMSPRPITANLNQLCACPLSEAAVRAVSPNTGNQFTKGERDAINLQSNRQLGNRHTHTLDLMRVRIHLV